MLKECEKLTSTVTTPKEYKKKLEAYQERLAQLQRRARELQIPVIIAVEGWGASGKGQLINHFILPLDPRGFTVYTIKDENEEESRYPFLWRFITKTPEKGRIAIFDRSWYRRVLNDHIDKKVKTERFSHDLDEINAFEKLLTDDDNLLIKFFIHISKSEQKKRLERLTASKETAWRVSKDDLKHNKQYSKYLEVSEQMLRNTDKENAPWHLVNGNDVTYATLRMFEVLIFELEKKIAAKEKEEKSPRPMLDRNISTNYLDSVDLSCTLEKKEYQEQLRKYQDKLERLHNLLYLKKKPVIIVFEGWDAAGKGGAIKRLTTALDPRGYQVFSTPAPTKEELSHHYLWRFWKNFPKTGHIAIFDRSWYGRVMVEAVEGFCTQKEYDRAFFEINDMEKHLSGSGITILKFFIHISKEEQLKRFEDRRKNPHKAWKLTDEDFRNREKWDDYLCTIEKMIEKTGTDIAPWHLIPGDDKRYARIEVLRIITETLEKLLKN